MNPTRPGLAFSCVAGQSLAERVASLLTPLNLMRASGTPNPKHVGCVGSGYPIPPSIEMFSPDVFVSSVMCEVYEAHTPDTHPRLPLTSHRPRTWGFCGKSTSLHGAIVSHSKEPVEIPSLPDIAEVMLSEALLGTQLLDTVWR